MNLLEIAGFVTGALSVWLAVRQNPWNWPAGVANAVCFLVLFWQARLYGDMALQLLFIAICLLGWYRWLYGGEGHSRLGVRHLTVNGAIGQKFRGPVGRSSGGAAINGYIKKYTYDDRLRFRSPPHFLDPVKSAWHVHRYTEQEPAAK